MISVGAWRLSGSRRALFAVSFAVFKDYAADFVGDILLQFDVANQEAHVEGAIEQVEKKVEVGIGGKFAAIDTALESLVGVAPSGPEEALAKGFHQFGIGLTAGENRGDHLAAGRAEDVNEAAHLQADVAAQRTGVGEAKFLVGAGGKSIDH